MPADIVVHVGAVLDRSTDAVWGEMEKRAKAFGSSQQRESRRLQQQKQQDNTGEIKGIQLKESQILALHKWRAGQDLKIESQLHREQSRMQRTVTAETLKTERALALQLEKLAHDRTRSKLAAIASEERAERDYQTRLVKMAQDGERQKSRIQRQEARQRSKEEFARSREIDRFATRTSHRATRFFFPAPEGALGYGKRVASDLIRGAGVDVSFGGGLARARERESAYGGIAAQERIATGKTVGARAWEGVAKGTAEQLAVSPEKVVELMRAFTGKTGEFDAVRTMVSELGSVAVASGADLGEMGDAAGFVYNQLKGLPGAGEMTIEVLRGIIGQTAVGSVEMEDYAKQMGRIAANAQKFGGDPGQNIRKLSALTQLSIATGGATSAADAARATGAFVNTFGKEARISAFAKQGVNLFEDQTTTLGKGGKKVSHGTVMRDPFEIIKDAIFKTQGDIPTLANMFADTLGRKPVTALVNAWSKGGRGGRGSTGEAAIDTELRRYMDAQLSPEMQKENVAAYKGSTTGRAASFQAKFDEITKSMGDKLLPALEKLAPKALELADSFSKAVTWATENPWKAVMVALTASIARAGFESLGRLALERVIMGFAGQGIGAAMGGAAGGMAAAGGLRTAAGGAITGLANMSGIAGVVGTGAGAATAAMALAAVGVAAFTATTEILKYADAVAQSNQLARAKTTNQQYFEGAKEMTEAANPLGRFAAKEAAIKRIKDTEEQDTGSTFSVGARPEAKAAVAAIERDYQEKLDRSQREQANASEIGQSGKALSEEGLVRALTGALTGKTLNVNVRNTDDFRNMTPADGGGMAEGPPVFSQFMR